MDGGGRIRGTENIAQSYLAGMNRKLGSRRQTLLDLSNIVREDGNPVICEKNYVEVMKENAQLLKNIAEKSKMIDGYEEEVGKLKIALQGARDQNWQLAESNSQMLAELNLGKDRLKNLQHELKCQTLVLEQKKLELQEKQRMNKQLQQLVKAQGKQVDLAAEASIGGKRKKTDSESNFQSTGQSHQEVPRRKLDDRRPLRRQSIAKTQIISSSNVQSVKAASSSGSGVSLQGEGRKSTRRTSIVPNTVVHMEDSSDDSSKLEEDKCVSNDIDMTIPVCAIKAEPDTEPDITKPVLAENEAIDADVTTSCLDPSSLYTEKHVTGDAVDVPCLSIVPVAASQLTAQDVHQEPPREKLDDSSTILTGDTTDRANPLVVPVVTAPLTTEDVCQEVPKQKLDNRKSTRRRSIATVHAVGSSHVQSVKTTSCSISSVSLHEEESSTIITGDITDKANPLVVPVATAPLTTEDVRQEAPKQNLDSRKLTRRRSIATVHAVSSSHVQSVKTVSCSSSNVPLHEQARKSTRRKSIRPGSGIQLEGPGTDSNNVNTTNNNMIPSCSIKSEPGTEQGMKHMPIKEESTDVGILDSSSILMQRVGNDAMSRPRPSLATARRASLSRPLPLRRALEKVESYREQSVNVKMRRVE